MVSSRNFCNLMEGSSVWRKLVTSVQNDNVIRRLWPVRHLSLQAYLLMLRSYGPDRVKDKNEVGGTFCTPKGHWLLLWITSPNVSTRQIGGSREHQPCSLTRSTVNGLSVRSFISFFQIMNWSSWTIFQPLPISERSVLGGDRSAAMRSTLQSS